MPLQLYFRSVPAQNAEHSGPADQGREHSTRCKVTSNTRLVHTIATVLLVHIGREARELQEHVAAWSQEGKPPTQFLCTALGWRCNSSLRRKRREVSPLLELCFHCTERRVLVLALSMRASGKCMFAIFIAPVDRESQHKFLW